MLVPTLTRRLCLVTLVAALAIPLNAQAAEPAPFPGKQSQWNGFVRYDFEVDGRPVLVVTPKNEAPGRPWVACQNDGEIRQFLLKERRKSVALRRV